VVKNHDDDGEGAEKIEARLALAIGKPWIDFGKRRSEVRGQKAKSKVETGKSRLRSFRGSSGTGPA
jgi:hypothetical protein